MAERLQIMKCDDKEEKVMAKQKAVVTTLKSPVQEDGSRFTLFPETISTAIVHVDKDGNQKTLDEITFHLSIYCCPAVILLSLTGPFPLFHLNVSSPVSSGSS